MLRTYSSAASRHVSGLCSRWMLGQAIPDQMQLYASDVTGDVFPCGHWVAEESPELLLKRLLPFLG